MFVPGNEVDVALPLGGASKHYIASRNGGGFYDPFYHQSDSLVKMAMGVQLVDDQADANMETAYLGGIAYLVLTREVNRGSVLKVCTSVDNAKETAKFMLCFHDKNSQNCVLDCDVVGFAAKFCVQSVGLHMAEGAHETISSQGVAQGYKPEIRDSYCSH